MYRNIIMLTYMYDKTTVIQSFLTPWQYTWFAFPEEQIKDEKKIFTTQFYTMVLN